VSVPLALSDFGNGTVLIVIALLALPIAAIAFAGAGAALKTLGKGRFAIEQELPARRTLGPPAPIDRRAQEAEVRQMLEAKSYRREQRGEAPLDVEAELASLTSPTPRAGDPVLREEVRQLVIARNERRLRQGKEPLDVEAEIDRQLRDLEG
jgi:hypothetical protein